MEKIVSLKSYKKSQKLKNFKKKLGENQKMFFLTIAAGALIGLVLWNVFIENPSHLDVQIPQSQNIAYNNNQPAAMTTAQIADQFESYDGKPVLIYIYTTWCSICSQQFPMINEIAREFQNTDLQILTLATDRDLDPKYLSEHLNKFGNLYFPPRYLAFNVGFLDFLKKREIKYQGRIPFTVLISRSGKVTTKFVGVKSQNYLRNKVIKELYL